MERVIKSIKLGNEDKEFHSSEYHIKHMGDERAMSGCGSTDWYRARNKKDPKRVIEINEKYIASIEYEE